VGVGAGSTIPRRTRWYWFRKCRSGAGSAILVHDNRLYHVFILIIDYIVFHNRLYVLFNILYLFNNIMDLRLVF